MLRDGASVRCIPAAVRGARPAVAPGQRRPLESSWRTAWLSARLSLPRLRVLGKSKGRRGDLRGRMYPSGLLLPLWGCGSGPLVRPPTPRIKFQPHLGWIGASNFGSFNGSRPSGAQSPIHPSFDRSGAAWQPKSQQRLLGPMELHFANCKEGVPEHWAAGCFFGTRTQNADF